MKQWLLSQNNSKFILIILIKIRFSIPSRMKKKFKNGLIKAAQSTDSLIITNGRNKLVGEAVEENKYEKIDVIGIIPSHVVAFRRILENSNKRQVNLILNLNKLINFI